jgi:hypothetical protein
MKEKKMIQGTNNNCLCHCVPMKGMSKETICDSDFQETVVPYQDICSFHCHDH